MLNFDEITSLHIREIVSYCDFFFLFFTFLLACFLARRAPHTYVKRCVSTKGNAFWGFRRNFNHGRMAGSYPKTPDLGLHNYKDFPA